MRVCAGLARTKLTLLTRSSAASRTTDTKYEFRFEFFFHGEDRVLQTRVTWMVNLEQFSESMRYALWRLFARIRLSRHVCAVHQADALLRPNLIDTFG
jgi:hypothetical protein